MIMTSTKELKQDEPSSPATAGILAVVVAGGLLMTIIAIALIVWALCRPRLVRTTCRTVPKRAGSHLPEVEDVGGEGDEDVRMNASFRI